MHYDRPGLRVASSGLADPTAWDDAEPTNGYELEVYGISADLPADSDTMTVATVAGPLSSIRLVNVKLLTAAEGRFCVNNAIGDDIARRELARRFAEQGRPLWSSLSRPSVV
ncbi:Uncharacterised protein [Nocardia otitidiscaviarum]|uniref:Uncharacterized protein n=1 Tax=Nocardia otitidiscaviarum TaxID=1823 RepID=A0A378YJU5_9NOCA|nr:hypothetical protein [Nocardia otitidiscaviarum]SUA77088.1 Uncharacterised protein [Nocardia otitidiscaviarum]